MSVQLLLGNDAIALGMVENGCQVVTAYPGTPSSEILAGVVKFKKKLNRRIYTEWSASEKVAFEVALAASWSGIRSATTMKQVGLNVAADPLFSAAYTGVVGGFVIVPCDDPGPMSSQTEQDSRLFGLTAKVPVFDPSTPAEAMAMVKEALELSERHRIPVILRPTTRVCHAVQSVEVNGSGRETFAPAMPGFKRDPQRWAATPAFRLKLHHELNAKLKAIEDEFEKSPLNYISNLQSPISNESEIRDWRLGIVASGVAFATAQEALAELGASAPILKIGTPYPLPRKLVTDFVARCERVLVIEEPDACIELQIPDRTRVSGRLDGTVPNAGELSPEVIMAVLAEALEAGGAGDAGVPPPPDDDGLAALVQSLKIAPRRPRLCPGCSHRSAFFTVKHTFGPNAIYPGDIGCYTLGTNLRAVDTCVDMGASVTMAAGFYHANRLAGDKRPIIATIGDSTFIHSGIVPLVNAVHTNARFILLILDNHTTAMTGAQPTPANDYIADGDIATKVPIPGLVQACGVRFVRVADPYDQKPFESLLKEAQAFTQSPEGGVAVIIADRPCILYDRSPVVENPVPVVITEECDGCRYCVEAFECPALVLRPDKSRVDIDYRVCVDCGQCIDACYKGFIVPQMEPAKT